MKQTHPIANLDNPFDVRRICPEKFIMEEKLDAAVDLIRMTREEIIGVIGYTKAEKVKKNGDHKERPFVCLFEYLNGGGERFWCHVSERFLQSFKK